MELGGPDYGKIGAKVTDSEGKLLAEATGKGPGYRYFGAAKNLPGVKELFEKEAPRKVGGYLVNGAGVAMEGCKGAHLAGPGLTAADACGGAMARWQVVALTPAFYMLFHLEMLTPSHSMRSPGAEDAWRHVPAD